MSSSDIDSDEPTTGYSVVDAALFSMKLCKQNLRSGYKVASSDGMSVSDLKKNIALAEKALIRAGKDLKASAAETVVLVDREVQAGDTMEAERNLVCGRFKTSSQAFSDASSELTKVKSRLEGKKTLNTYKPNKAEMLARWSSSKSEDLEKSIVILHQSIVKHYRTVNRMTIHISNAGLDEEKAKRRGSRQQQNAKTVLEACPCEGASWDLRQCFEMLAAQFCGVLVDMG